MILESPSGPIARGVQAGRSRARRRCRAKLAEN